MFDSYKIYVSVAIGLLLILVTYVRYALQYWKKKNVPYVFLGNFRNTTVILQQPYNYFRSKGHKFFGIFLLIKPALLVLDLELLKHILTKDFQHFNDHGSFYNEKDDPLSAHLFALSGEKWKRLRIKLTPTFTSGKMKMMFQTLLDCSKQLEGFVNERAGNCVDIKEVLACFTTDVIGSCAFGLDCNSFEGPESPFRKYGKKVFAGDFSKSLKNSFLFLWPELARRMRLKIVEPDVSDFFLNVIRDTIDYRRKNDCSRNDFVQLLMNMQRDGKLDQETVQQLQDKTITLEELAAQAFIFFLAGFETSSTTMTFCLYELALNPDIQEKVRNEIDTILAKHDGEITYDAIMEMKYMGQVIDETLRKYPPVPTLPRKCSLSYKIPDTDVIIEKGTQVMVPVYQIHHDPKYFPEPEEFRPERFAEENKSKIHPYSYLPFGEGPRICIGLRFGIMQAKVGLTVLLRKFRFTLNQQSQQPLSMDPNTLILTFKDSTILNVHSVK